MSSFCPKCGNAVDTKSEFCIYCGHKLNPTLQSDSTEQSSDFTGKDTQPAKNHGSAKKVNTKKPIIIIVIIVVVCLIASLLIFIFFNFSKKEDNYVVTGLTCNMVADSNYSLSYDEGGNLHAFTNWNGDILFTDIDSDGVPHKISIASPITVSSYALASSPKKDNKGRVIFFEYEITLKGKILPDKATVTFEYYDNNVIKSVSLTRPKSDNIYKTCYMDMKFNENGFITELVDGRGAESLSRAEKKSFTYEGSPEHPDAYHVESSYDKSDKLEYKYDNASPIPTSSEKEVKNSPSDILVYSYPNIKSNASIPLSVAFNKALSLNPIYLNNLFFLIYE
ncbi:MAG: zinc ribbon domain-containing protein [Coriobacteriales bacterium]|nr:zinc ribbon domain-containing protein [Coriobacteriales bacterium]